MGKKKFLQVKEGVPHIVTLS